MTFELEDETISCVQDNIIITHNFEHKFNPNGLGDQFYKLMLNNSSKIAQINGITDETQTYEELLSRCVKSAKAMLHYGVKPGDLVTPITDNHMNTCIPFIASLFIGAIHAPLDIGLRDEELRNLLEKYQPKIIFCSSTAEEILKSKFSSLISEIHPKIVVFGNDFEDFLKSSPEDKKLDIYKVNSLQETAYITLTGGSTGNHKAGCPSHLSLFNFVDSSPFSSEINTTLLSFSPLIWLSCPLHISRSISLGCSRLIVPKFEPKLFFHLIAKHKITNTMQSGRVLTDILNEEIPREMDLSLLKSIKYSGSPLSKHCIEKLNKMLPSTIISSAYGQSEVGGFLLSYDWYLHPEQFKKTPNSVGRPMKGFHYKLVDINTGEILGPNRHGHLLVKSVFKMNGYYKSDSSNVYDDDGWMKTGDILYYDDEYFFYFVDRMKEMIRYRSWSISPLYLEDILRKHSAVEFAFITGVPDDKDGDHPIGAVVLKEGKCCPSQELEDFVNKQVEETSKIRKGIKIINNELIPYSAVGKLQRYELRKRILGLLEQ